MIIGNLKLEAYLRKLLFQIYIFEVIYTFLVRVSLINSISIELFFRAISTVTSMYLLFFEHK